MTSLFLSYLAGCATVALCWFIDERIRESSRPVNDITIDDLEYAE